MNSNARWRELHTLAGAVAIAQFGTFRRPDRTITAVGRSLLLDLGD